MIEELGAGLLDIVSEKLVKKWGGENALKEFIKQVKKIGVDLVFYINSKY